jgi:hypothetical protein
MIDSNIYCKNCGNNFHGTFCNKCGEKVYNDQDKSVKHIFEEALHFITHFEGTFITTIKTIFKTPGKLSLEYCNGLRKKYFKPVSLFLLLVVMYLLFPRFQGLNMKLETYANTKYGFAWVSAPLIKAKTVNRDVDFKELALVYNAKSPAVSKLALFFIIPLAAAVLFFLFFNTKKYFFDHFIVSLELSSFYIATHFLFIPFFSFVAEKINKNWQQFFEDDNLWLTFFQVLIDLFFVAFAFKRFYTQKWGWTIIKTCIYVLLFQVFIIYLYRLIVLVVTLVLS